MKKLNQIPKKIINTATMTISAAGLSVYLLLTGCNGNTKQTPAQIAKQNNEVMKGADSMTGIQPGTTDWSAIKGIFESSFPKEETK